MWGFPGCYKYVAPMERKVSPLRGFDLGGFALSMNMLGALRHLVPNGTYIIKIPNHKSQIPNGVAMPYGTIPIFKFK